MGNPTGSPRPVTDPLARVLGAPDLARLVPQLAPEILHLIIRQRGLDACEDLVVFATPAQLAAVFDLDLWQSAEPGEDERFDAGRFGEWIEMLVQAGDAAAARTVAGMDRALVVAGLSRHVRVFDAAASAPAVSADDEPVDVESAQDGGLACDVGGYVVRARRSDAWDAIVALLVVLDVEDHDCFHELMRECRRLSDSARETDGLDNLFAAPEQLLHDVASDRERRRSQHGYITPADARAFLDLARYGTRGGPARMAPMNPIAAACLRTISKEPAERDEEGGGSPEADSMVLLLAQAGLMPERPRGLLPGAGAEQDRLACIRALMEYARQNNAGAYVERGRELAFLANAMMAGCSVQARRFTPQEASDAAVGVCNLGLEHWPARWPGPSDVELNAAAAPTIPPAFLIEHDLVSAFEMGWALLHQDVSLYVARQLVVLLARAACIDGEIQKGLYLLRRELVKQCETGTPWRARDALDVVAALDVPAWAALLGLLDECPVVPAALTAIVERRTGAISATAFDFIATRRQFHAIRQFVSRLPALLAG